MKFKPSSFLAGVLCAVLILTVAMPTLAATGAFTITVNPINIEVNGEVFKPTDVNGNPVEVFEYNGTTYAPLRALAEAYGLEVGYDAEKNLAYVQEPEVVTVDETELTAEDLNDYSDWSAEDEAAYQEFVALWDIEINPNYPDYSYVTYVSSNVGVLVEQLSRHPEEAIHAFCKRLDAEIVNSGGGALVIYWCGDITLWTDYYSPKGGIYGYNSNALSTLTEQET